MHRFFVGALLLIIIGAYAVYLGLTDGKELQVVSKMKGYAGDVKAKRNAEVASEEEKKSLEENNGSTRTDMN